MKTKLVAVILLAGSSMFAQSGDRLAWVLAAAEIRVRCRYRLRTRPSRRPAPALTTHGSMGIGRMTTARTGGIGKRKVQCGSACRAAL